MPLFGSHLSIAGGVFKAVEAATALSLDTVQIFTHSPSQWSVKAVSPANPGVTGSGWQPKILADDDIRRFRETLAASPLRLPCAHNSYLINVASSRDDLWEKSIAAMIGEIERAESLGLQGVVMHPGSCVDSSVEEGLTRICQALDIIHERTRGVTTEIWLETTAGQGTCLGHRFEHLASILQGVQEPERLGICVDTCHIFAAGYPLQSAGEYAATFDEFDRLVGVDRIRAFHINDSKKPLGSRVDRHEHIGEGCLGLEPFRHLMNDARFAAIPMHLETEKGMRNGENLDEMNLRTLKSLIKP